MVKKKSTVVLLILILLFFSGCSQDSKKVTCDTVAKPSVNVVCKDAGVYSEFNIERGINENKKQSYCYAYPSGETGILYRGVGYQSNGVEQDWGESVAGGSFKVGVYKWLEYVEVYPNLDGVFCDNKKIRIEKNMFTGDLY